MRVDGVGKLARKLDRIRRASAEAARSSLLAGAEAIASTAQSLAPKDTADLAGSIQALPGRRSEGSASAFVECDGGHPEKIPAHVEFGTIDMQAEPFMRPAFRRHADGVVAGVTDAVKRAARGET